MPYIIFIFVFTGTAFSVSANTISVERKAAILEILARIEVEQWNEQRAEREAENLNQLRSAVSAAELSNERKQAVLEILDEQQAEKQAEKQAERERIAENVNRLRDAVSAAELSDEKKQAVLEILAVPDSEDPTYPAEPVEPISLEQLHFQMRNCTYQESAVKRLFPNWNQRHWCEDDINSAIDSGYTTVDIKQLVGSIPTHSRRVERVRQRPVSF